MLKLSYKKIILSFFLFLGFFVCQKASADTPLEYVGINNNYFEFKAPFSLPSGYSKNSPWTAFSLDTNSSFYQNNMGGGSWSFRNSNNQYTPIDIDTNVIFSQDSGNYVNATNGLYWTNYGNKMQVFICKGNFVSPYTTCEDNTDLSSITLSEALNNPNLYSFIVENNNGVIGVVSPVTEVVSAISSVSLNGSLLTLSVPENPFSLPLKFSVSFTNSDVKQYPYLARVVDVYSPSDLNNSLLSVMTKIPISQYGYSTSDTDFKTLTYSYPSDVNLLDKVYKVRYFFSYSSDDSFSSHEGDSDFSASYYYSTSDKVSVSSWTQVQYPNRPVEACSISNLDACLSNAFLFLFRPSDSVLDNFNFDSLSSRIPFSYISEVKSLFESYVSAPSSSFVLSVPLGSQTVVLFDSVSLSSNPVASMVRSALSVLLWFFLPLALYKRVVNYFSSSSIS